MAIQSLRTGDCIDEVLNKYSDMVYRLALVNLKSKHNAEDVLQDVFLALISKPRTFNDEEHLKAWLIRVTINRSRSLISSAWFKKIDPLDENLVFETSEETDLFEYLFLLPQKYRSVIHLFYGEDLTVRQIGTALNQKESTVRSWLTRARAILRAKLKGDFFNE